MGEGLARLWLAATALALGAALGDHHHDPARPLALAVIGAALLARRRSMLGAVGLAVLSLALGWFSAGQRAGRVTTLTHLSAGAPRCFLAGRVLEGAGGLGTLASVEAARCGDGPVLYDAGVVVFDDPAPAGARFAGEGYLLPLGDSGFDTSRRRLGADASWEPRELALSPPRAGAFRAAEAVRNGLASAAEGLGAERAALLRGLALGDTTALDARTIELFRRAGLSHLLAVSGSNVAIVLGAVGVVAVRLPLFVRCLLGAGALGLFVLVVGPEPSVLRAAAMGATALLALALGRGVEPLHALGLAVVTVIGARPQMVFSLGLQLSVAATAGLILSPRSRSSPFALLLGATVAAQLAVAPLLVLTFGELSLVAPLANVLAVPAVAPATVLGVAGALAGTFHPGLGALVVTGAGPFLSWILFWGERLGSLGWSSVTLGRGWAAPLSALALAAGWIGLRKRLQG